MKRGIFALIIITILLSQFSAAGTISEYFNYFTNDAFSMITGLPFSPSVPQLGNIPEINDAPSTASKASGASCTAGSECRAKVCTKINNKGICGKGLGKACSSEMECYSGKCSSGKCLKGKQGKPCMNANDCEQNLKCTNNRCTPAASKPAKVSGVTKTLTSPKVLSPKKENIDSSKSLELEVKKKLSELNSKADSLLAKHKNKEAASKTSTLPSTSLKSSLFPSLTGKFLLAIPMPSVNLFTPPPERSATAKKANGQECTSSAQCNSGSCAIASSSSSKKYCGLANGVKCTLKSQCASQNCGSPKMVSGKLVSTCQPKPSSSSTARQRSNPLLVKQKTTPTSTKPRQGALKIDGASCQKSADCKSGLCKCTIGKCAPATTQSDTANQQPETAEQSSSQPTLPTSTDLGSNVPGLTGMVLAQEISIGQNQPGFVPTKSTATQKKDEPLITPLKLVAYLPKESGASCTRNEECSSNLCVCSPGKGKCQKFTPFVPPKQAEEKKPLQPIKPLAPVAKPAETPAEAPQAQEQEAAQQPSDEEKKFNGMSWECYDSTKGLVSECKTSSELVETAKSSCEGKCSAETGKCGVNSYSMGTPCDDAADAVEKLPEEAEVAAEESAEKKCDDSSKESIEKLNKEIKELKRKVCLEASRHRGIDYGDVVCKVEA